MYCGSFPGKKLYNSSDTVKMMEDVKCPFKMDFVWGTCQVSGISSTSSLNRSLLQ